jgi:ABC-type antimicrobial peptide transport system permease subunit
MNNLQLTLAARYLQGRKLRTVLTTIAIIFGVLLIFGMNTVLPTMIAALQINVQGAEGNVDFAITHVTVCALRRPHSSARSTYRLILWMGTRPDPIC